MDLGLPGMSGIDAARALKQNPTTARIPIIGQSAWDHRLWKKVALEAGMVEYIQKPFRPERLKDAIERFITHNVQHSEHGEKVPWLKRALFLVVVSVIALFTGVYLLRSGLTACRCGRYHYGSGDWLDA
jgi:DNA-binding response OmpR family regulator